MPSIDVPHSAYALPFLPSNNKPLLKVDAEQTPLIPEKHILSRTSGRFPCADYWVYLILGPT